MPPIPEVAFTVVKVCSSLNKVWWRRTLRASLERVYGMPREQRKSSTALFEITSRTVPVVEFTALFATLVVKASTVSGNFGKDAGGLYSVAGNTSIANSTISGNNATGGAGGGIWSLSGDLEVSNST